MENKLQDLIENAIEEFTENLKQELTGENFKTRDEVKVQLDYLDDRSALNDWAWEIADRWVPINYSDISYYFAVDGFEINENYEEMKNEIGVHDDDDLYKKIQQGIFWAIYREIYDQIYIIKEELIESYPEEVEEETEED